MRDQSDFLTCCVSADGALLVTPSSHLMMVNEPLPLEP